MELYLRNLLRLDDQNIKQQTGFFSIFGYLEEFEISAYYETVKRLS